MAQSVNADHFKIHRVDWYDNEQGHRFHWTVGRREAMETAWKIAREDRARLKLIAADPDSDYTYSPNDVVKPTIEAVLFPRRRWAIVNWLNANLDTNNG